MNRDIVMQPFQFKVDCGVLLRVPPAHPTVTLVHSDVHTCRPVVSQTNVSLSSHGGHRVADELKMTKQASAG